MLETGLRASILWFPCMQRPLVPKGCDMRTSMRSGSRYVAARIQTRKAGSSRDGGLNAQTRAAAALKVELSGWWVD